VGFRKIHDFENLGSLRSNTMKSQRDAKSCDSSMA